MGMTSAAEAKLDARVRPQIVELRSRTPYPKRRSEAGPQEAQPPTAATRPAAGPPPMRLTRRGRIVVGTLIGIGVTALAAVIWLAVAGQAQASGNAKAGRQGGGSGTVARIVVKPGQTLWGIAARVDPGADPRVIIPQIVELNSLTSTAISVGQVLWVPRG